MVFHTTKFPDGMKGCLRAELAHDAPELEGVPGVKTAVTDTEQAHGARQTRAVF